MVIPRTQYWETPIWNRLAFENVNPESLLASLQDLGTAPVISTQLICELAASFQSRRSSDPSGLGRRLFAYLHRFVLLGIPCLKMNCQLLQDEAMMITGEITGFDVRLSEPDYKRMAFEVQKLAQGTFEAPVQTFLENRRQFGRDSRAEAAEFGRDRHSFKPLCETSFGAFLNAANPIQVVKVLREHLREEFPDTGHDALVEVAAAMLRNPTYRVANAMVRADLYTTWRAIRTGTLPRDVLDDCYHLVNACYCDSYATKDGPQAEYAPLIVRSTDVFNYDGVMPISDWLLGVAAAQSA